MKKISEMNGHELRTFLGIESAVDVFDINDWDDWDNRHHRDFYEADDVRSSIIEIIVHAGFVGIDEPDEDTEFLEHIKDEADMRSIAEEVVNSNTYTPLFDSIMGNVQLPDDVDCLGMDAIIAACIEELILNRHGRWLEQEDFDQILRREAVTVKELSYAYGMSFSDLADRFYIPCTTIEDWAENRIEPPYYVLPMMHEILENDRKAEKH